MRLTLPDGLGLLALAACLHSGAQAQTETAGPVLACRLDADEPEARPAVDRAFRGARPAACAPSERTARFEVEYVGFPADARAAFQAAVDVWACRVVSPRPIRMMARWESLAATTLGSAGPYLLRNFDGAPRRDTWYPSALADAFAGRDLAPNDPDLTGSFNASFPSWHLDPATPPPADRFDLATVVLHEIGHGLGFIGALAVQNGLGYVGAPGRTRGPYAFDVWTETGAGEGTPLLDAQAFPDGSAALSAALRSGDARFDGPAVRQGTGAAVPLYAPPTWDDGASYSHLDEAAFAPATPDGLLTPFLARGESVDEPGTAVCAVLADVGWTLAGDCAARVGARPSVASGLRIERTGPNPVSRQTSIRATPAAPGRLRATLVDVLGRRVAVLADRSAGAGESVDVVVDARGLAAGVYRVVVQVEGDEAVVPIVVVR